MTSPTEQLCHDLLISFVKVLELRNPFNIEHCALVAQHCELLAKDLGLPQEARNRLVRAAEIHTLGVLLQMEEKEHQLPISRLGERTGRESSVHRREEEIFETILSGLPSLKDCRDVLLQRHEWFDGTGSVLGLSGETICLEARIMAVVDAYVDLVTQKAHRPPESHEVAIARLKELSGRQFDPRFVDALASLVERSENLQQQKQRARLFEEAHCRHYLRLGHFYTQIHETEWALRSYIAAQKMAQSMEASGLELGAISGQFMVYCERQQLELAREVLKEVELRGKTQRDKLGYQLLWGILEWLSQRDLGKEILHKLISKHRESKNIPGLTAALGFQASMTLFSQGSEDPEHLAILEDFLTLIDTHDVFDVIERYRPYTIPVFLNAVIQDVQPKLARNLLTRMGEPCQGALRQRLSDVHPAKWTKTLMSQPVLTPLPEGQKSILVKTLGVVECHFGEEKIGIEGWQTQKTLRLFLSLATQYGQAVSSEALIEQLWPDASPKKGRDSLRNCLHKLRQTLRTLTRNEKAEVVSRSRKNQTLTLETPCRFDYQDFERQCHFATQASQNGQPEEAFRLAAKALEIHRGEFLETLEGDWIEALRARLVALRNQALVLLTKGHIHRQEYDQAEAVARQLLELDNLREESHILLMEALAQNGRSAEAVEHYELAMDIFESEIGVAPQSLRNALSELGLLL